MSIANANAGVQIYLALQDKGFAAGLEGASSRLAAFAQRCQGLSQQIGIVSQSINVGLAAAVRQFAAFDDQMRMVAGITGSAGSEFENLTQLAQKLGRETSFTAAQVAGGMVGLGRMGFDSGEIKDSIKAVMDLSRATGTDLAPASEIAGNALRVFGLRTSETGTVADLLATVTNRSAQTLADVGEALKTAGPHAARAGESLQDTAAAIGVLANMGIRGSMAGNAIGRTLKQIADPQVAAKLAEMGVATTGADGNLRKLKDILVDIARVSSTMKSGEQIAFFEDIFNARGSLAGGTLAANLPAMERMGEALANCGGAAADLAAKMDQGVGGSLRLVASAAEGVVNALGNNLAPTVQKLAEALQSALGKVADAMSSKWARVAVFVVAIPAAFGAATTALGLLSRAAAGLFASWGGMLGLLGRTPSALVGIATALPRVVMAVSSFSFSALFQKIAVSALDMAIKTISSLQKVAAAWKAMFAVMAAHPVALAITAVVAAATAMYMAFRKSRQELRELIETGKDLRENASGAVDEGNARRKSDLDAWNAANAPDADAASSAEIRKRLAERYGADAVADRSGAALRQAMLKEAAHEAWAQYSALESRRQQIGMRKGAGNTAEGREEMRRLADEADRFYRRYQAIEKAMSSGDISPAIEGQAKSMEDLAEAAGKSAEEIAKAKKALEEMRAAEDARGKSPEQRELEEIAATYRAAEEQWRIAGEGDFAGIANALKARLQSVYARNRAGYDDFLATAHAEQDRRDTVSRMESGFGALLDAGDFRGAESFASFLARKVQGWVALYTKQKAEAQSTKSEDGVLMTADEKAGLDKIRAAISAGLERVSGFRQRIAEARDAAAVGVARTLSIAGTYRADAFFARAGLQGGRDDSAARTAKATEKSYDILRDIAGKLSGTVPLVLSP